MAVPDFFKDPTYFKLVLIVEVPFSITFRIESSPPQGPLFLTEGKNSGTKNDQRRSVSVHAINFLLPMQLSAISFFSN